jgi:hypothetical protein
MTKAVMSACEPAAYIRTEGRVEDRPTKPRPSRSLPEFHIHISDPFSIGLRILRSFARHEFLGAPINFQPSDRFRRRITRCMTKPTTFRPFGR